MGLHDPRTYGSKNPGATNVLRSGSKAAALVTLLLDAMKGWLPVVLVRWFGQPYGLEEGTVALVMFAAFAGHLYPIFFRFAGGKGVATAFGVWLGAQPLLMLVAGVTWLLTAWLFRYSSLASLVVALVVPLLYVFVPLWMVQPAQALSLVAMSGLLIWRHAENIRRLRQGTESRLGKPKPMH